MMKEENHSIISNIPLHNHKFNVLQPTDSFLKKFSPIAPDLWLLYSKFSSFQVHHMYGSTTELLTYSSVLQETAFGHVSVLRHHILLTANVHTSLVLHILEFIPLELLQRIKLDLVFYKFSIQIWIYNISFVLIQYAFYIVFSSNTLSDQKMPCFALWRFRAQILACRPSIRTKHLS